MDNFCKFCGCEHTTTGHPQTCDNCGQETWHSPKPVGVLIQTVYGPKFQHGVLIGKREIEPSKGEWGLVGGYIDPSDKNVFETVVREFREETGIERSEWRNLKIVDSFCNGEHFLVFVENQAAYSLESVMAAFVPNKECSEIRVAWEPEELCFPSHTMALRKWFSDLY